MSDSDFQSRYRLDSVVRRGALGTLYLAEQNALKRTVLLRVVAAQIADDPTRRRTLVEMVERLSRTDDKAIAPILDLGEFDGQPFYAMERCDGVDLRTASHSDALHLEKNDSQLALQRRVAALMDFLRTCRKLHGGCFGVEYLRPTEVLLLSPFRFVLSEPGLAACSSGEADGGLAGLQRTVELAFAVTFDPAWDVREGQRKAGPPAASSMSLRSSLFLGLSRIDSMTPERFLDRAIEVLRSVRDSAGRADGSQADVLVQRAESSARWRIPRRLHFRGAIAAMLLAAAGLAAYGVLLLDRSAARQQVRFEFARAVRAGDLTALAALAGEQGAADRRVQQAAERHLDELVEVTFDAAVTAALTARLAGDRTRIRDHLPAALPAGRVARLEPALVAAEAALDQRVPSIRAVFESDTEGRKDALLTLVTSEAPTALIRAVLLRLLDSDDMEMSRSAAAALAAGVAGEPIHFDDRFERLLADRETDPATSLALIGYYRALGGARAIRVLQRTATMPDSRRHAPSPNKDRFTTSVFRAVHRDDDVLRRWIGDGFGGRDRPAREDGPVPVRSAALFALEQLDVELAIRLAERSLDAADRRLRPASIAILSRHAERMDMARLSELLRWSLRRGEGALAGPLLRAIAGSNADEARSVLLAEAASTQVRNEAALLAMAAEAELVDDAARFCKFLAVCSLQSMRAIAGLVRNSRALLQLLDDVDLPGLTDEALRARVALVRGFLQRATEHDIDELVRHVGDRRAAPSLRAMALDALAKTEHFRASGCLQEVIADERYPRELRFLALSLVSDLLGSRRTRFVTSRVDLTSRSTATGLLRSMVKALEGTDQLISDGAANNLAEYESQIVTEAMAARLTPETPLRLLEIATGYFADVASSLPGATDLDARMLVLLDDPYVDELIKANVLRYLASREVPTGMATVLAVMPELASEEAGLAALGYLSPWVDAEGVQEALVDYLESDQSLQSRLVALDLLTRRLRTSVDPDRGIVQDLLATADDPEVVFGCVRSLHRLGAGPEDLDAVIEAFRRFTAMIGAVRTDPRPLSNVDARVDSTLGSPLALLDIASGAFDDALATCIVENDMSNSDLAIAASLLILRLAKANEPPDRLDRILRDLDIDLTTMVGVIDSTLGGVGQLVGGSVAADLPFDYMAVLDYLCDRFRARREPAPFRTRAKTRIQQADYYSDFYSDLDAEFGQVAVPTRGVTGLTLAIEDLKWAVSFTSGEEQEALRLELFQTQQRAGDLDGALETLRIYRARRPNDADATYVLADHLLLMDRLDDAFAVLDEVSERGVQYWRRRMTYTFDAGAARSDEARALVERLLDSELCRDSYGFISVAPTVLANLFEVGADERFAPVRARIAARLDEILRTDYSWRNRDVAAFHLAWLAPADYADSLAIAARTDTNPAARKHALWGLSRVRPGEATKTALEQLATNDAALRPTAYWVLARAGEPERLGHLQRGFHPRSGWVNTAMDLAVTYDEAAAIPWIAGYLNHPQPELRAVAARALGTLGLRGHPVDVSLLRECYMFEVDDRVRMAAGTALAAAADDVVLDLCRRDVRAYGAGQMSEATAQRVLPSRLGILAAYDSPEARELVETVLARCRTDLAADLEQVEALVGQHTSVKDDEAIGDLADSLVVAGEYDRARALYETASKLDPHDSEWTEKLALLDQGVADWMFDNVDDPILFAAASALGRHRSRAALGAEVQAAAVPNQPEAAPPATTERTLAEYVIARLAGRPAGPEPGDLDARLQAALELVDSWPILATASAPSSHVDTGAASDPEAMGDLFDMFEAHLPEPLRDAIEVLQVLEWVDGRAGDGRSLPLPMRARKLGELWANRRR